MKSVNANEIIDAFVNKVEFIKSKLMKWGVKHFPSLLKEAQGNLPKSLSKEFTSQGTAATDKD